MSILEEAVSLGAIPQFSLSSTAPLDLCCIPPCTAEVRLLTMHATLTAPSNRLPAKVTQSFCPARTECALHRKGFTAQGKLVCTACVRFKSCTLQVTILGLRQECRGRLNLHLQLGSD